MLIMFNDNNNRNNNNDSGLESRDYLTHSP